MNYFHNCILKKKKKNDSIKIEISFVCVKKKLFIETVFKTSLRLLPVTVWTEISRSHSNWELAKLLKVGTRDWWICAWAKRGS